MGGFFLEDLTRLLDFIAADGGDRAWFEFGGDGRGVALVRFVDKEGELVPISYHLTTDERAHRTKIKRIVESDV